MRSKALETFNLRVLAFVLDLPQGHRTMRRLVEILRPNRPGVPGESVELNETELLKAALILQMWDCGTTDEVVRRTCGILHAWLQTDLRAGFGSGFILMLRTKGGEVYCVKYVSRRDWEGNDLAVIREQLETISRKPHLGMRELLAHPEELEVLNEELWASLGAEAFLSLRPTSWVLFDLRTIFRQVAERMDAYRQENNGPRLSVDDMVQAFTVASQIRDQVDKVPDVLEK